MISAQQLEQARRATADAVSTILTSLNEKRDTAAIARAVQEFIRISDARDALYIEALGQLTTELANYINASKRWQSLTVNA